MRYDFITVGGATRDISFFTDQGVMIDNKKDILRQKLLGFESGAKIKVDKFYYSFGGGATNAAACLANFGFKIACLTSVGDDTDASLIIKNLKERNISTRLVKRIRDEESGSSFILIDPSGERIIFAQRGANRNLEITRKDIFYLRNAKHIYISSLSGDWLKNLEKIFSVVSEKGPNVFWNPGMTQLAEGVDKIKKYLQKTTVLACNKDEALALITSSKEFKDTENKELDNAENLAKIIHSFGPKIVVITLGSDGVVVFDGEKIRRYEIIKAAKCVDTTGIGDIFNSSFSAGWTLLHGNIDKAVHLSLQNAAAKVSHIGAQNSLIKI